jgi:hypothetical protein
VRCQTGRVCTLQAPGGGGASDQLRPARCRLPPCLLPTDGRPAVDAIFDTLRRGGDTDTNAAIVGGLVGALHGTQGIPAAMSAPTLARNADSPGQRRPEFLQTKGLLELVERLYGMGQQGAAAAGEKAS